LPLPVAGEGPFDLGSLALFGFAIMLDHSRAGVAADQDFARFQLFGYLTFKLNYQQAVGQIRALHKDMVRQLEAPFKIAIRNADMQKVAIVIAIDLLLAGDNQQVLLRGNVDFLGLEACNGNRHDIFGIGLTLDIERRIIIPIGNAARIFEQVEQPVKTNGCAAIGSEIKTVHEQILLLSNLDFSKGKPAYTALSDDKDGKRGLLFKSKIKRPGERLFGSFNPALIPLNHWP
jgi:hypothetical protein